MMNNQFAEYQNIPKEKFQFANQGEKLHDQKLSTKPIGYFKDAWIRFRKNKSSVIASFIIIILVIFAIVVPMVSNYTIADRDGYYATVLPRSKFFAKFGIWDGTKTRTDPVAGYDYYSAIGVENGKPAIVGDVAESTDATGAVNYTFKVDTYNQVGFVFLNLSEQEYLDLQKYQNDNNIQIMYPIPNTHKTTYVMGNAGANFWYKLKNERMESTGEALRDENGNLVANYMTGSKNRAKYDSLRIEGDNGGEDGNSWYVYAVKNQTGYKVRVDYEAYYTYTHGFEPNFLFGTNAYGQDILTCLAQGARLSLLLAVLVSVINLTIGAIYGAIEGYYGGVTDIVMERIIEILSSIPMMV